MIIPDKSSLNYMYIKSPTGLEISWLLNGVYPYISMLGTIFITLCEVLAFKIVINHNWIVTQVKRGVATIGALLKINHLSDLSFLSLTNYLPIH